MAATFETYAFVLQKNMQKDLENAIEDVMDQVRIEWTPMKCSPLVQGLIEYKLKQHFMKCTKPPRMFSFPEISSDFHRGKVLSI